MNAFDRAWPLLKEYYPDDISDEDYEEAEYAQNPQWPHKNWMESPQWPQLCDFVIEGVGYNGCGRVIDGEEVTGLPMMSGQAMCHDCLREVAGPPPKIVVQGTPKLEDDSWQDSIERGEPMSPFDQAWALTKDFRFLVNELNEKKKAGEPVNGWDRLAARRSLGGYDNQTGDIYANLNARDLHDIDQGVYRGRRNTTDEEKEASVLSTLRHEGDHKALDRILSEALQPRNHPIPYKADTSKPNPDLEEEYMGRYDRGHEYALMALDSMRRQKGSGSPRMRIGTTVAPNRRFRRLRERYSDLGYDLDDLVALESKTLGRDMNAAMGRRARENARRLMGGSDQ